MKSRKKNTEMWPVDWPRNTTKWILAKAIYRKCKYIFQTRFLKFSLKYQIAEWDRYLLYAVIFNSESLLYSYTDYWCALLEFEYMNHDKSVHFGYLQAGVSICLENILRNICLDLICSWVLIFLLNLFRLTTSDNKIFCCSSSLLQISARIWAIDVWISSQVI